MDDQQILKWSAIFQQFASERDGKISAADLMDAFDGMKNFSLLMVVDDDLQDIPLRAKNQGCNRTMQLVKQT